MSDKNQFALGLIGCGSFGLFSLEAFSGLGDVRIAAVADTNCQAAEIAGAKFGVPSYTEPSELIARDDVDLVYIATPPSSHYDLVLAAIAHRKHVLCEKPLAMSLSQADEMLTAAAGGGVILPVNFILRHNAVTEAVKRIIDSGVIGRVLSGRLTNCAFDTLMPPDHWFWNKNISGGIFIEHGVHFFDLYRYWCGPGEVISAHTETREGTVQEDRVTCEIRHESGAIVSHYHGFDQIEAMDRTEHHLVCEMGDIRVQGWVPLTLRVDAALDDDAVAKVRQCIAGSDLKVIDRFEGEQSQTIGRGIKRRVTQRIGLDFTPQVDKQLAYANSVRDLLADQVAFIRDRSHTRRIIESNGRDALGLAEAAARLAEK